MTTEFSPESPEKFPEILQMLQRIFHGFGQELSLTEPPPVDEFRVLLEALPPRNAQGTRFIEIRPRDLTIEEWMKIYELMPPIFRQWLMKGALIRREVEEHRRRVNDALGGF